MQCLERHGSNTKLLCNSFGAPGVQQFWQGEPAHAPPAPSLEFNACPNCPCLTWSPMFAGNLQLTGKWWGTASQDWVHYTSNAALPFRASVLVPAQRHDAPWHLFSNSAPKLTQSQCSYQSIGLISADDLDIDNFLMVFIIEFNMSHICIKTRDMLDHLSLLCFENGLKNKLDQIQ